MTGPVGTGQSGILLILSAEGSIMNRSARGPLFAGLVGVVALAGGCSSYRGIPSHGGGKRFDEEQRAVAGAIRRTVSSMELDELKDKRTAVVVSSLATSGSGATDFSGLTNLNANGNAFLSNNEILRRNASGNSSENSETNNRVGALGLNYQIQNSYRTSQTHTEGDLAYLRAALDMKARHAGVPLAEQNPEVVLHVLVDVLGTNHSRRDFLVYEQEQLVASCEVTYYAQEVKTGNILFKARQTGSAAKYSDGRVFFVPVCRTERSIENGKPLDFDIDEAPEPDGHPVELPADFRDVKRVVEWMKNGQREDMLDALTERARFNLKNGNRAAAQDYIDTIRGIDPGFKGLGDLDEDFKKLDPGTGR